MTSNKEILYLLLTKDGFEEDVNIGIVIWQHSDKNNELLFSFNVPQRDD
jgi:hypothetical protein